LTIWWILDAIARSMHEKARFRGRPRAGQDDLLPHCAHQNNIFACVCAAPRASVK
jgi:hypothetical protein